MNNYVQEGCRAGYVARRFADNGVAVCAAPLFSLGK